jgi:NAD(P)-dependent dehydrogenase (short-subunit alcohol dehydrogenase family)
VTGRVEGKVAFITGAARGQGRSHAITLAREGADIIAIDLCAQIGSVPYPMATPQDLAQTVKEVEATGRRIVATVADVRDYDALKDALDAGVAQLGRLDIVSANAGITSYGRAQELPEQTWQDVIDVNLTGEWHAAKAAIPHLRAARPRRIDHLDQLRSRAEGCCEPGPLRVGQSRCHRADAHPGAGARAGFHPGQCTGADRSRHSDGHEFSDLPAAPPGPGEPDRR